MLVLTTCILHLTLPHVSNTVPWFEPRKGRSLALFWTCQTYNRLFKLRRPLELSPLAPRKDTNNSDYCLTITASGALLLFKQPPLSVNSTTQSDTAVEVCLKYVLTTLVCVDVSVFTRLTNSFIDLYSVQL